MKEIQLTQGRVALVYDEDFEYLSQWKWYFNSGYAVRSTWHIGGKRGQVKMHRLINKTILGLDTDHINSKGLDNRKINLRSVSHMQNCHNTGDRKNSSSKHKGVYFNNHRGRPWKAQIRINGKRICLGTFDTETDAAKAFNNASIKFHKEYGRLNKIELSVGS